MKTLWEKGQRDETRHEAVAFFKREYLMNYMLATSKKNVRVFGHCGRRDWLSSCARVYECVHGCTGK